MIAFFQQRGIVIAMGKFVDLVGQRFGGLTVLERAGSATHGATWKCKCDCGAIAVALAAKLKSGHTKSCGCARKSQAKDLSGRKFGRLTVIDKADNTSDGTAWNCECDCGGRTESSTHSLRRGGATSCGCVRAESVRAAHTTHGMTGHALDRTFAAMRRRCYDQAFGDYKNYGGRGITVCDEWLNDKVKFFDWGLANGWEKGLTIDRIDNDGNYEPSNCRFATPKQQSNNRRVNIVVNVDGEELSGLRLAEYVSSFGIVSYRTFIYRVKHGTPPHIAASTPVQNGRKHIIGAT